MNFKDIRIAVIGLGYVGLPLAVEFAKKYTVFGFDINQKRIDDLRKGIGGFFSDFSLSIFVNYVKKGTLLLLYLAFVSVSMYVFSLSQTLTIGMISLFFLNFGLISTLTIGRSLLGSEVPDRLRGRFGGLFNLTNVLSVLGALFAGILAENYSVATATQVCCVIMMILVIIIFACFPSLRSFE